MNFLFTRHRKLKQNLVNSNEEQSAQQESKGLTFRQKFWLLAIGVPLLLIVALLVLAAILPRSLNPTEKQLLGRWEIVDPPPAAGRLIFEFREHEVVHGSQSWSWKANEVYLATDMLSGSPDFLGRIKLALGLVEEVKWRIELLDQKELRIRNSLMPDPLVFKRLQPVQP